MGFLPKIPFINKPKPQQAKPTPLRGLGGKFISPDKIGVSKKAPSSRMETVTMSGHKIRMFVYEDERYYCVDDIVKASGTKNPEQFLKDFNNELAEAEVEENGQKITLQFARKQQMMPIISALQKTLPKAIVLSLESLN